MLSIQIEIVTLKALDFDIRAILSFRFRVFRFPRARFLKNVLPSVSIS